MRASLYTNVTSFAPVGIPADFGVINPSRRGGIHSLKPPLVSISRISMVIDERQNVLTCHHADDVAFIYYGQLADILGAH